MSIYYFGSIIKKRREQLQCTQEDLADGICSVPTLSRIENGERMPSKSNLEMLLQRLGYSDNMVDIYIDEDEFRVHNLKYQIRQAYILGHLRDAAELYAELKKIIKDPTSSDLQFMELYRVLLNNEEYSLAEQLSCFEKALKRTCPKYTNGTFPVVLSYEEIILLNNIALCSFKRGKQEMAVTMLMGLKHYYETQIVNQEECLRTQTMTLYNLSKMLGLMGRCSECIDICNLGIRIAQETGRCNVLSRMLYNKAWVLIKGQDNVEMGKERAAQLLKKAYYMAICMAKMDEAKHYEDFYFSNYGEHLSL